MLKWQALPKRARENAVLTAGTVLASGVFAVAGVESLSLSAMAVAVGTAWGTSAEVRKGRRAPRRRG
ncbi:MAG: hypothetical protein JWO77_2136 [Ilumatobacteraceae bacterium]|nr:hypothetical protein [Ilumatobacteraceae bacterium]